MKGEKHVSRLIQKTFEIGELIMHIEQNRISLDLRDGKTQFIGLDQYFQQFGNYMLTMRYLC